mgnify:CR=1 FL=1
MIAIGTKKMNAVEIRTGIRKNAYIGKAQTTENLCLLNALRKQRKFFLAVIQSGLSFAVPDHESGGFAEGHLSLPSGVLFHVGTDQIWDALHGLF